MKQSNEGFDKFIREYRSIPGQTVEYKTGVRDMLRRLKEGYFVGLLCDQDPGIPDLFLPFWTKDIDAYRTCSFCTYDRPSCPYGIHAPTYGLYLRNYC